MHTAAATSLHTITNTAVSSLHDTTTMIALQIFNRIDAMYNIHYTQLKDMYEGHWHILEWTIVIVITVGVAIIPLLIAWYQNRSFKKEWEAYEETVRALEESFKSKLIIAEKSFIEKSNEMQDGFNKLNIEEKELAKRLGELSNVFEQKLRELSLTFEEKTRKAVCLGRGLTYASMAEFKEKEFKFSEATLYYSSSIIEFLNAEEYVILESKIEMLKELLNKLNVSNIGTGEDFIPTLEELVTRLSDAKYGNLYKKNADDINKLWNEAKVRLPPIKITLTEDIPAPSKDSSLGEKN